MLSSSIPSKVPLPFANSGTKNTIPTASQIGITPGAASLTDGFPPLTMTPIAAGGIPPAGADFNGILNMITAVQQWQSAGGIFKYDSAFSTAIGGYPAGAVLMGSANDTYWLNLADNNTTDPESSPANWASLASYGITAVTGLTNTNITLTPAQYSRPIITLAGTLTGNVQIIFPTTKQKWLVANNTTGAFAVTCKTAAGTGGTVATNGRQEFYGDGTNLKPIGSVASLTTSGYRINPDGTIDQWGAAITTSGAVTVTWPIQFPNAVTGVSALVTDDAGGATHTTRIIQAGVVGLASTNFYARDPADASRSGTIAFSWRAIGY